jgi:2-polyprenyl-3-methyl-5-hydroxy-6-metoxy-1,4-benzoquinol methylase
MDKVGKSIGKSLLGRSLKWMKTVEEINSKNTKTLLKNLNQLTSLECDFCHSPKRLFKNINSINYYECEQCKHIQCEVIPSSVFLKEIYSGNSDLNSSQDIAYVNIEKEMANLRIEEIAVGKVEFVIKNVVYQANNLWIDIGSGVGDILLVAKDRGFEVLGFEASTLECEVAKSRGVSTINSYFDPEQKYPQINRANIISLFNVLEHAPYPINFLVNLVNQMNSNAYIIIEVPKNPSLSSIIQKSDAGMTYRHIFPPEHLNIFSRKSMEILSNIAGFEIISTWSYGSDAIEFFVSIINLYDTEFKGDLQKYAPKINSLQKSIDGYDLSDNMIVVGKKIGA